MSDPRKAMNKYLLRCPFDEFVESSILPAVHHPLMNLGRIDLIGADGSLMASMRPTFIDEAARFLEMQMTVQNARAGSDFVLVETARRQAHSPPLYPLPIYPDGER